MIDLGFKLEPYTGPVAYRRAGRDYRAWLVVPDDFPDEKRTASTSEVMLWAILQELVKLTNLILVVEKKP